MLQLTSSTCTRERYVHATAALALQKTLDGNDLYCYLVVILRHITCMPSAFEENHSPELTKISVMQSEWQRHKANLAKHS